MNDRRREALYEAQGHIVRALEIVNAIRRDERRGGNANALVHMSAASPLLEQAYDEIEQARQVKNRKEKGVKRGAGGQYEQV